AEIGMLLDVRADGVAVLVGHDDVGDDDVGAMLGELREGGRGVGAGDDVIVLAAECNFDDFAHGGGVVDEINGGRALGVFIFVGRDYAFGDRRKWHKFPHSPSVSAVSRADSSNSRMASSIRSVAERKTVR